jgi:small-conductance mechanosensitive channel
MSLDGATRTASLWSDHANLFTAIVSFAVALALAALVNRALSRRGRRTRITGRLDLTPEAGTRLRFLRRALVATIVLIGAFIALSQFDTLDRIATSVLASGALAAAVLGFAARQTLANVVAGVMIAITQPLRIGDEVTFEGESGRVEDVRLTYTYIRNGAGARVIVPNERLAAGVLRNDTILEPDVATDVSLWLSPEADANAAVAAIEAAVDDAEASIADVSHEGTRLKVAGGMGDPHTRAARENTLRAEAFAALRAAGLR